MNGSAASSTGSAAEAFPALDALPPACAEMFLPPTSSAFCSTRLWYEATVDAALPPGTAPVFMTDAARTVLLPLQRAGSGPLRSLTTPYTCLYTPLIGANADRDAIERAAQAIGTAIAGCGPVRLDALAADEPALAPLLRGFRRAGLRARRFDHFGNWHEPIRGRRWDTYLASRDGALRETIRRRLRAAGRDKRIGIEVFRTPTEIDTGVDAYEAVYARSWKEPEPFPRFNPRLIRAAAGAGCLRLAVMRLDEAPIAAQFWIVAGGAATVLKLAHDEAHKALSPGTVLTATMLRSLLDDEGVDEVDFGRGDDPYKQRWAGSRRQRIGIVLAHPLRPAGLAYLATDAVARVVRRMRRRPGP